MEVTLYYQTTSREYIEFLRNEINGTGNLTLPAPIAAANVSGIDAPNNANYIIQTEPFYRQLKAWGDTIWRLWTHNMYVDGARPFLMDQARIDTPLAITLSWFLAARDGTAVNFRWQTSTETGVVGWNVLAMASDEQIQLNDQLIRSPAIDSIELIDYSTAMVTDATVFYLEEVKLTGHTNWYGLFDLDVEYGAHTRPHNLNTNWTLWLPAIQR